MEKPLNFLSSKRNGKSPAPWRLGGGVGLFIEKKSNARFTLRSSCILHTHARKRNFKHWNHPHSRGQIWVFKQKQDEDKNSCSDSSKLFISDGCDIFHGKAGFFFFFFFFTSGGGGSSSTLIRGMKKKKKMHTHVHSEFPHLNIYLDSYG